MTTFDYVVPVGCNCRNTWNLRRHFGFGNGFPFDWWITPLPALLSLLQKFDIPYLYAPELLEAVSSEDGSISSIRHRELGIFFTTNSPAHGERRGLLSCQIGVIIFKFLSAVLSHFATGSWPFGAAFCSSATWLSRMRARTLFIPC